MLQKMSRLTNSEAKACPDLVERFGALRPDERWMTAPHRVAHVVDDRLEHRKPHLFSERFLDLRDPAKLRAGHPAGLGGWRSGADVPGGEKVEVHLDLLIDFPLEAAAREQQIAETGDERDGTLPHAHSSPDSRRTRAMTAAMRSQSSVWAFSCRRPAGLMV